MIKHVMVVANESKDPRLSVASSARRILEQAGVSVSVYGKELSGGQWEQALSRENRGPDAILVMGGDGTMLRTADATAGTGIPLLGVNLGTTGYLAEVEKNSLKDALEKLLAGKYAVEERMMLYGQVWRGGRPAEEAHALNDVAIVRCGPLQMLSFQIDVNGMPLKTYQADGMIVSTPTGSTGYNLSAGGPIVEPGARLLLLTPVCPHTLQTRSVILCAEDEVRIRPAAREGCQTPPVEVCFDGGRHAPLSPGDEVRVARSQFTIPILKLSEASFLDILHRKLSE